MATEVKKFVSYNDYGFSKQSRIAYTIIYNGIEHLKHNDFALKMLSMFDYWFVVDGAAGTKGSTAWCKDIHKGFKSTDGTVEYLQQLSIKHNNLWLIESEKKWISKDEMVNTAIENIKMIADKCWLYQVDADEQWQPEQLEIIEKEMTAQNAKTGKAYFTHYVGKGIKAIGDWGSGTFTRIWNWQGELFASHEPPKLITGNGKEIIVSEKFSHYSYYFENDVLFKSKYYKGYEQVYANWKKINEGKISIPCHISMLLGSNYRKSNSQIVAA